METNNSEKEIREKLSKLKEEIEVLEWDAKRMQINPYKKAQLGKMKKEYEELKTSLGRGSEDIANI